MLNYTLYIVRLGLTDGNLDGRYIGRTDLPLCAEGRRQIEARVKSGVYPEVSAVYSSPLLRSVETAGIIYPGKLIKKCPLLTETDFGIIENKTAFEAERLFDAAAWLSGKLSCPPGGEPSEEFSARIVIGIEKILTEMSGKKIMRAALITHGGVIMRLLALCGLPKVAPEELLIPPGGGFQLRLSPYLWGKGQSFEIIGKI